MIPSLEHLRRAYVATSRATQVTPLLESTALARLTGAARVFVKPESLQWAGSFKVRGAYWRLSLLSPEEKARGVVAYSSGNFAQGLAAAGEALGIPVTIVMPIDAPRAKSEATKDYGARVVVTDHGSRPREEVALEKAREIAAEQGLKLLHPFDDPEIVAGQAGAGLEAIDQLAAQAGERRPAFMPCRRRRTDRRRLARLPLPLPADANLRRRARRLRRHGRLARARRDRNHAVGRTLDLRRADGAPPRRRPVRSCRRLRACAGSPFPTPPSAAP